MASGKTRDSTDRENNPSISQTSMFSFKLINAVQQLHDQGDGIYIQIQVPLQPESLSDPDHRSLAENRHRPVINWFQKTRIDEPPNDLCLTLTQPGQFRQRYTRQRRQFVPGPNYYLEMFPLHACLP